MQVISDLPSVFEEFDEQKRKSFLELKEYKERGKAVVGMYCAYFPTEFALAVDAIPVGLCSFSNSTVQVAEQELPKSMCPLIKSSYGFFLEDKCPFLYFADLVVGETTCDGKKKMFELMADKKNVWVMNLPNSPDEMGLEYWKKQIILTKEYFEEFFQTIITDEKIRAAIHLNNDIRKSLKRLCEVMKLQPTPVSGMDIQKIMQGYKYRFDFESTPALVNAIVDKILEEYETAPHKKQGPRILITGCPVGGDTNKVIKIIEENGGVVVAMENCSGVKSIDRLVDEDNPDPYDAIARRYLSTGCSIMTPNDSRIELIGRIVEEYAVDGVIEVILKGCHSTGAEAVYTRKFVMEECKIPYLPIDVDYSMADYEQLSVRIAAFLELVTAQSEVKNEIDITEGYKIIFHDYAQGESFEKILHDLWDTYHIPMVICDEDKNILYSEGELDVTGAAWERKFLWKKHQQDLMLFGVACNAVSHARAEKLLELVEELYNMENNRSAVLKKGSMLKEGRENNKIGYFCWVLLSKTDREKLKKHMGSAMHVLKNIDYGEYVGWLLEGASNEKLKATIKMIEKTATSKIWVGHAFHEKRFSDENLDYLNTAHQIAVSDDTVNFAEEYQRDIIRQNIIDQFGEEFFDIQELEDLKREDEARGSCLYDTLFVYLEQKRNATRTAQALNIHRNTLLHRLELINKVMDVENTDYSSLRRIYVAMLLSKKRR